MSQGGNVFAVEAGLIFSKGRNKGENIESTPSSVLIMEPFISLET